MKEGTEMERNAAPPERGRELLTEISRKVVGAARERCVRVKNTFIDGFVEGSGVIIETGLVLTNYHVIEENGSITVNDHDAQLIHFDLQHDLAALATKTRRLRRIRANFKPYRLMPVFYVGNPDGCNKSVARGDISFFSLKQKMIRSTVACDNGYSGSGLFDARNGNLVGINDLMVAGGKKYDFAVSIPAEIVFRFLANEVLPRFHKIRKSQTAHREIESHLF